MSWRVIAPPWSVGATAMRHTASCLCALTLVTHCVVPVIQLFGVEVLQ
jgi:hypothetical protein